MGVGGVVSLMATLGIIAVITKIHVEIFPIYELLHCKRSMTKLKSQVCTNTIMICFYVFAASFITWIFYGKNLEIIPKSKVIYLLCRLTDLEI